MTNNTTFTALPTSDELAVHQALFARKLAIAEALFATTAELNAIDIQPYVTTIHCEVSSIVRRIVLDAVGDEDLASSIVDHAYDSDVATATKYVIGNFFSSALARFTEATDGVREGWYTVAEYNEALAEYNVAFDLLNNTVGHKAVK